MTNLEMSYQKKDFRFDEPVPIPQDVVHRVVDGRHHVFISPQRASYIVTSQAGARFVDLFHGGATLGGAVDTVRGETSASDEDVARVLRQILLQVEKNGFYSHAEVVEDLMMELPILCYLTKLCNLRCVHCYADAGPTVCTAGELTAAEWAKVFDDYGAFIASREGIAGRITLTGGEAMVRKDFFEIAAAARRQGVYLEVFSNGTLIRDAASARRLAATVDDVQISLDGASAEVNDAIRGQGTYRKILKAIELVIDAGMRVRLAVTVMPMNVKDIADNIVDLIKRFGKDRISVRFGLANVQGRADTSVRFSDSVQGEQILRTLLERLYEEGLRRPRRFQPNLRSTTCGYARNLTLANDGTVYGCAIEAYPLGNVKDEPFGDIAGRIFELGREAEVDNIRGCRGCELRYFCNGGCRLNNLFMHKDLRTTCCTREMKSEVLRRITYRELANDPYASTEARVGSFWFAAPTLV